MDKSPCLLSHGPRFARNLADSSVQPAVVDWLLSMMTLIPLQIRDALALDGIHFTASRSELSNDEAAIFNRGSVNPISKRGLYQLPRRHAIKEGGGKPEFNLDSRASSIASLLQRFGCRGQSQLALVYNFPRRD